MHHQPISLFILNVIFVFTAYSQNVKVNQDRLEATIFELSEYGKDEQGVTNRVAYSDADVAGRTYVVELMKSTGMDVHIDNAGNIIGKRKGKDPSKKPIAFGSHIDMVPNGGNYDGCVGSLAAIEIIRTLNEANISTDHPLEVIIFSNEEGAILGSRAMAGVLTPDALSVKNSTGFTNAEGLVRIGGDPTKLDEVVREKGSLAAFVELHIEQGANLYEASLDIGIVEGIVGLDWWDVEITGFANHAGTTPMNRRQDAMLAAARFVQLVNEVALSHEGAHVATVGRIKAEPGAPNVIPGRVVLSLEIRDLSSEKIQMLYDEIVEKTKAIEEKSGTKFNFNMLDTTAKPALMNPMVMAEIKAVTEKLGLTYKNMPSGAGHDAQDMALIAPTGMIFVPSVDGISHSPKEFTSAEDMANGANVLMETILSLDVKLP